MSLPFPNKIGEPLTVEAAQKHLGEPHGPTHKNVKHSTERVLLTIYGTPCGGTQSLAGQLQRVGILVGHERMGHHGYVCGFAPFSLHGLAPHPAKHTWRLMRDPLKTMETLPFYAENEMKQRKGIRCPWWHKEPTFAALAWWVCFHELYAHLPALHVEDLDWAALVEPILGHVPERPEVDRNHKARRYDSYGWDKLVCHVPDLVERAQAILKAHGRL